MFVRPHQSQAGAPARLFAPCREEKRFFAAVALGVPTGDTKSCEGGLVRAVDVVACAVYLLLLLAALVVLAAALASRVAA